MELDDLSKPKPVMVIGENLEAASVAELTQRVKDLETEIVRVKVELTRKEASRVAADSFFKT
jgi:uncharacterized small protein (DUF1192 family)